ncbi:MAG TPA: 4-hydroxythreonine-4-phosphate dehydrogenase PdxA [Candidatus Omnitrophota bacterium]|nr:4-hydroxythreonine-4-phosphate dehydrogenase PdxA [Candidatus Omnitrophota bacterium]
MLKLSRKTIGITLGDPCGIGPEVTAKALKMLPRLQVDIVMIGDQNGFLKYFTPGKPNPSSARASLEYLNSAVELLKRKKISALVTAPVSKESISALGVPFEGHTEFLARAFGVKHFGMMFVTDVLKTILVTRHIPLNQVSEAINPRNILGTIELVFSSLRDQFQIKKPRIAVCGLNPHAGEGGTIGQEEKTKIIPAIARARQAGIDVFGPLAADTLFCEPIVRGYDAAVAMYHDQGLIAIKSLYFSKVVNLTLGLPFVRTSPAHGTAFDIAGKNKADPSSMLEAIKLALRLSE